jgi:hypothetical protein
MAVRLLVLLAGRPLSPRKIPDTLQGHSAAGRIRLIEKSNDLIGIQTRDLTAYNIVLQIFLESGVRLQMKY